MKRKISGSRQSRRSEALQILERHFNEFNRLEYLKTDPVCFLHEYKREADQEFIGLLASSYAYGSAKVFLPKLARLFPQLGSEPSYAIRSLTDSELRAISDSSTYRFFQSDSLFEVLSGFRNFFKKKRRIRDLMETNYDDRLLPSLGRFRRHLIQELQLSQRYGSQYFFADPERGVAKRLHLFLRWMVRKDQIDLGIWNFISKGCLFIPLDTHVFQLSRELHLTRRKQPDLKAMIEITDELRTFDPEDPVRFDFSICRYGMLKKNQGRPVFASPVALLSSSD